MNSILVDFDLFQSIAYKLLDEVRNNGKTYQAVLCPLRGGFYLSYFMSRHLNLPMEYIQISSYEHTERKDFTVGIRSDLKDDLFLLCDDICDSGRTIQKIHGLYPRVRFDSACLVAKEKEVPTYYGMYVPKDVWVNFFWEIM